MQLTNGIHMLRELFQSHLHYCACAYERVCVWMPDLCLFVLFFSFKQKIKGNLWRFNAELGFFVEGSLIAYQVIQELINGKISSVIFVKCTQPWFVVGLISKWRLLIWICLTWMRKSFDLGSQCSLPSPARHEKWKWINLSHTGVDFLPGQMSM